MRAQPDRKPILIGDGIENPCNVTALRIVASMFDWDCGFLNGSSPDDPLASCDPIVALENSDGAEDLYGFQAPPGARLALVVGNERSGISRPILDRAQRTVHIPMASPKINTVNVAAAAAIALYRMSQGGRGRLRTRPDPGRSRPEILIVEPRDPIEVGSAVRSAAALGWGRMFIDDRQGVWFAADRVMRSLGRGAARRGRNEIHVLPSPTDSRGFDEAIVVTVHGDGEPLERVDLARGSRQLIVIPDESAPEAPQLSRIARQVRHVRLNLPASRCETRLRLIASIVFAEVARQVGVRQRQGRLRDAFFEDEERT
jgi:hypothetical protein